MIKKLNLLRTLMMLSFLTLFALSCKKDDAKESENPLNDAKEWYTKLTANAKTALTASNNNTQNITKEFLWNKAKVFKFSDGKEVIGTPVNVFMTNHKAANGSYMLLIYKTDHNYHSQIIYNAKNNYFSEATTTDIEAAFMVSEKNNELKSLAKGKKMVSKGTNGKVMVRQDEPPVCTDWYWTTYTYDNWGNVIAVLSEVYVYTTCEGEDGGGSGPIDPEEEPEPLVLDFGQATDILESSSIQFENDTARLKKDVWIFLNAETFDFKSRELIYQVKTAHSGGWVFGGITHDSHYVVGNVYYGDVSIEGFKWEKTQSLQNVSASVEFRTKIVLDTPFGGGTKYGDMEFSIHNWNSW